MKMMIIFLFIFNVSAYAEMGRKYFSNFLGHVHKSMSKDSTSLTVVQCSHSVKILSIPKNFPEWSYVQVGEDKGYIQSKFLSDKKPSCLQAKYPEFYKQLNLDVTDMYFWGKLYDQYFMGSSKIK